jgi:hypothetical protein
MKSDCGEKAVKDKQTGKTYLLKFKYLYFVGDKPSKEY